MVIKALNLKKEFLLLTEEATFGRAIFQTYWKIICRQSIYRQPSCTWNRDGHICTSAKREFLPSNALHTCIRVLHWFTCAFDRVNHWTLTKKLLDKMLYYILWNCWSLVMRNKSLWYDGVSHCQWHSDVEMETVVSIANNVCTIVHIPMSYTITSKQHI